MSEATLTSKGQITIPADIRRAMGLEPHDRVVFTRLDDDTTIMRAKTRKLTDLKGVLKRPRSGRKISIEEMNIGRRG
jgi:AbrB family looped-hinge helix DNA binding protein